MLFFIRLLSNQRQHSALGPQRQISLFSVQRPTCVISMRLESEFGKTNFVILGFVYGSSVGKEEEPWFLLTEARKRAL